MKTIAVLGTLDTKAAEHVYVADIIRSLGHQALLIDVGCLEPPQCQPDISREEVAAAGGVNLDALREKRDRGESVAAMAGAAASLMDRLVREKRVDGIISLGGGGGTAIATAAMRALPLGFPKLMVSTLAAGNVAPYVGTRDIVMFPSIVDVSGINRISRVLLARAAGAICGMVSVSPPETQARPLVVASMFGNTTQCVNEAKAILEQAGYEVLVFHATGTGGRVMESLVGSGLVSGVLDVTTTEWADEHVGGILGAGPERMDAAAKSKVPSVVAPGCLDMVNFGEPATVPAKFAGRTFYQHNPQVTLMRTTPQECAELGKIIAGKVNGCAAPVTVLLPRKGVSVISAPGGPFHDKAADDALFDAIKGHLKPGVPVVEMDCTINDPAFARACAEALLGNMQAASQGSRS